MREYDKHIIEQFLGVEVLQLELTYKYMKATFYEGNKTFSVKDTEVKEPAAGEVRIKVAYCGVCGTDVHIYHGMMDKRVSIPQIIGHEMSGEVDAVGAGVEGYSYNFV